MQWNCLLREGRRGNADGVGSEVPLFKQEMSFLGDTLTQTLSSHLNICRSKQELPARWPLHESARAGY